MAKKKVVYWFGADVTEFEKGIKRIENRAKRMSYSTAHLGKIMSKNITAPIVGIGALAIRESIAFESAFAKVKKTVIGTKEQLKKLERGILEMSTVMPTSAKGIAEVAASAGQLGIETENVLGFAKAMIQLGETSNMSADEAADALARFSNITGMSQKDFDRLGSTVVALGNSLATTEREVVDMGLALAGAGRQIGMTEPEILAFAGSLSSVGISAERGGSAFSRLMMNMKLATVNGGQSLNDFASIAGMTASQFKNQFEKDASGAIIKFIQGLAGLEGTGTSAIEVLDKMGIKEIRLRDSILRATGASEMFTKALALGRKEWEQNNAMQKKTAEFYKTTEAQLKILRNQVYLTGKEIGDTLTPSLVVASEKLRDVVKAFSDLSPKLKTNIVEWGLAAAAIGPLLIITSKAISGFKELLLNARKFTAFLSSNPALLAVAAMVATYSTMDKSPGMQETLSERRGLGDNSRGLSKKISDQRKRTLEKRIADQRKRTLESGVGMNSLAAIHEFDKLNSTLGNKGATPTPYSVGGDRSSKKGKSEIDLLIQSIQDRMKYLGEDGDKFLVVLDKWQAKLKPLSEDWKKITDLKIDIQGDMARKAGDDMSAVLTRMEEQKKLIEEAKSAATEGEQKYYDSLSWENSQGLLGDTEYLDALKRQFSELGTELEGLGIDMQNVFNWSEPMRATFSEMQSVVGTLARGPMDLLQKQFEAGAISSEQYRLGLENIKQQYQQYPAVVKSVDDAIKALNDSILASTRTLGSFIREAETALKDNLVALPDTLSGAFAGAIAYGEDLGDTLKSLAKDIAYATIKAFLLKSIFGEGGIGSIFGGFANGGVFNASGVTPFANGGIVNKPTLFPFANGTGLMGEAGPEAIMPLKRGADGSLGVAGGGGGENVTVNMTVNAMDSKSVVDMLTKNKGTIESLVVSTFRRNGALRGAIRQGV